MSVGYYVGGIIADKRNSSLDVALLLLLSATAVTLALVIYESLLGSAVHWRLDVRIQAVIVATLLFAPASFVLGMISPYLAKLNVRSLSASGRSVASLSALNSIGGIAGTFMTGFVLFSYVGSGETMILVIIMLIASSWLIKSPHRKRLRIGLSVAIVLTIFLAGGAAQRDNAFAVETPSAHYEIEDFVYKGMEVRGSRTGPHGVQSGVYLNGSSEPVFWYTQQMAQLTLEEKPARVLMLGGGTFTLPEYLAEQLPDATIDVVEIDPELAPIARNHFFYSDPSNVNLIFTDARAYLNQSDTRYDVILVDVYGDTSIPFSLMTREYGEQIANHLEPDGVVLANIVAGTVGACRNTLDALSAAYLTQLRYARYNAQVAGDFIRANILAVYSNRADITYGNPILLQHNVVYTDNYAPAEQLYHRCLTEIT